MDLLFGYKPSFYTSLLLKRKPSLEDAGKLLAQRIRPIYQCIVGNEFGM